MSHHGMQFGLPGGHAALPGELRPLPHWVPDTVRTVDVHKMMVLAEGEWLSGSSVDSPPPWWVRRVRRR